MNNSSSKNMAQERSSKFEQMLQKFKCKVCDKSFNLRCRLKSHENLVHSKDSIKCHQCEKHFGNEKYLQNHVTNVHTNSIFTSHCLGNLAWRKKST